MGESHDASGFLDNFHPGGPLDVADCQCDASFGAGGMWSHRPRGMVLSLLPRGSGPKVQLYSSVPERLPLPAVVSVSERLKLKDRRHNSPSPRDQGHDQPAYHWNQAKIKDATELAPRHRIGAADCGEKP